MAEYKAPVKEMNFVLEHIADMPGLARLPGFEDASSDMVAAILDEAGRVAGEVLSPLNVIGDQTGVRLQGNEVPTPPGFKEAYQAFTEGGWGSLQFDPEYGGQGLPYSLSIPVMEMWQSANMSWGLCPLLSQGAVEAVDASASDLLKQVYLPNMISGEWTGTMNLTEPNAGSDLSVVRSKAQPVGDHYLIKGQKIFITWGEHDMADNIIHLVLARLPDAEPGVRGISLFLVPKFMVNDDGTLGARNDCAAVSLEHKLGIHASPTCVMSFGDNAGAVGYLIGEEGKGLACMFKMMNNARLAVGLQGVAISERAYQHALEYAADRTQGRAVGFDEAGAILRHADVRRMLLTMKVLTEAGRSITYDACASLDRAHRSSDESIRKDQAARAALLTPIVKGWCTEVSQEVTSLGVQVHGGMGFIEETGAAQHFRDARILPIYEGTNGIQALDLVGRKTIFDNGEALTTLLGEMRQVVSEALNSTLHKRDGERLAEALAALEVARDQILASKQQPQFAATVAYNFLMLSGFACGAWQLLRQSLKAQQLLQDGAVDTLFLTAKQQAATFYISQILPRYRGYAQMITDGSEPVMAMSDEALAAAFN